MGPFHGINCLVTRPRKKKKAELTITTWAKAETKRKKELAKHLYQLNSIKKNPHIFFKNNLTYAYAQKKKYSGVTYLV
jgi:hypothetical protein